jgi:hypothetical protein
MIQESMGGCDGGKTCITAILGAEEGEVHFRAKATV